MRVPSAPANATAPTSLVDLGLKPSRTTLAMTAAMMHQEGQLFQKPKPSDELPTDAGEGEV
jgi:hypothetical protein